MQWLVDVIHGKALQRNRRRNCIDGEMRWVHLHKSLRAWQTTVARRASATPRDGCWSPSRGCAVRPRGQIQSNASSRPSWCNRTVQCHCRSRTRDDCRYRQEWRESLVSLRRLSFGSGELFAIPQIPTMILRPDQQCSLAAWQQRRHHVARKSIGRGVVRNPAIHRVRDSPASVATHKLPRESRAIAPTRSLPSPVACVKVSMCVRRARLSSASGRAACRSTASRPHPPAANGQSRRAIRRRR